MGDIICTYYCIWYCFLYNHWKQRRSFHWILLLLHSMGPESLMVPDFLSFPASRSEFCSDFRNDRVYCAEYPRVLSSESHLGIFTCPISRVGIICDLPKRLYSIYESDPEGVVDADGCEALKSAQLIFFSGIGGRDVFADFAAVRLSFTSCSASKFSARLSALST